MTQITEYKTLKDENLRIKNICIEKLLKQNIER